MAKTRVIGIDLGGTQVRAGLFGSKGRLLRKIEMATPRHGGKRAVLEAVTDAINELGPEAVKGIGIGMAGLVDPSRGVFLHGPNLPRDFRDVRAASIIGRRYGVPVRIENDARCFALAEARLGAGKGKSGVFGMTLGTGIGGGLVRDGLIIRGSHAAAGEIGHLPVADETPGHPPGIGIELENVASGSGIERVYETLSGTRLGAREIEKAYKKGDRRAKIAFEIGRRALVKGFAAVQLLFDPDIIVVGGGLGRSTAYWKPAASAVRTLSFPSLKKTRVVPSALGIDAGMIGASLLV